MTQQSDTSLSYFLREVQDNLTSSPLIPGDWMSEATHGSIVALHDQVQDVWMAQRKGLRARFHAGVVVGHAGPANQILKAVLSLNEFIVQTVNRSLVRPYADVTDAVREELGMWIVPATRGSVVLELVCPPAGSADLDAAHGGSPGQTVFPGADDLPTRADAAVDTVLDVLQKVVDGRSEGPGALEERLVEIGTAATSQLRKFVDRCLELGVDVDLDDRSGRHPVVLKVADSRYLRDTISSLGLDQTPIIVEGEWRTGSLERNIFDIRTADGTILSGSLPKALRVQSAACLRKFVQAEITEHHRGGAGESTTRRVLQKLYVLADSPPPGWGETSSPEV